jgi:hypothetical protein
MKLLIMQSSPAYRRCLHLRSQYSLQRNVLCIIKFQKILASFVNCLSLTNIANLT